MTSELILEIVSEYISSTIALISANSTSLALEVGADSVSADRWGLARPDWAGSDFAQSAIVIQKFAEKESILSFVKAYRVKVDGNVNKCINFLVNPYSVDIPVEKGGHRHGHYNASSTN